MCVVCVREKDPLREGERMGVRRERERKFTKELLYHFGRPLHFQFRVFECECENTRKNTTNGRAEVKEKNRTNELAFV